KRLNDLYNIQLVVSFFIDKSLEYQAMVFSTINRTQKKVSESLVYSLFGLTTSDSPQKSALQITLALNAHINSPFYNRIKLYGGEYERKQSPPLSQATMVKSIIDLICENIRESENDRFRDRTELKKRSASSAKKLPFRSYYAKNEDTNISDILFHYFNSVKNVFQISTNISYWSFDPDTMKPTNILQTTVGYLALLDILVDILDEISIDDRFSDTVYSNYLSKATDIDFEDINRFPFTSKSKNILYLDLHLRIWPPTSQNDKRIIRLKEILKES
ncbi:MAG TPA: DGQHR domain-containing protein, partial [Waddliaceae bacterium]